MKRMTTRIVFLASLVLLWQLLWSLEIWPPYVFPSPLEVLQSMIDGFVDTTFPRAIAGSLRRVAIGFGVSVAVGVPLGILVGRKRLVENTIGTLVMGLQALPSISWLPLAMLWFGLSERSIVFVIIMGGLMAITISTADGVRNSPPIFVKAARTMGARGFFLYRRVILPSVLPAIVSGLKLGWSFAWRSLMAGELLYMTVGLGQLLTMGRELNDMARVIAVMLVIIFIGLLVDRLIFAPVERRLRERWGSADTA